VQSPLLIPVRKLHQRRLRKHPSEELDARWQVAGGVAHRHAETGLPGVRTNDLAVIAEVLRLEGVDQRGRVVPAGVDDGVELEGVHGALDGFAEGDAAGIDVGIAAGFGLVAVASLFGKGEFDVAACVVVLGADPDDVFERSDAVVFDVGAQEVLQVGAEGFAPLALAQFRETGDHHGVDDRCAQPLHINQCLVEQCGDFRVYVGLTQLAEDADARFAETVHIKKFGVVRRRKLDAALGNRVGRVVAGHRLHHAGGVGDGTAHRPHYVVAQVQRHDALATDEAEGGAEADQGVVRRRAADGVAGIRPQADGGEVACNGGGGAAARPRRDVRQVVRLACGAEGGTLGVLRAEGPLGHIRFGDDDGTGFYQWLRCCPLVGAYILCACWRGLRCFWARSQVQWRFLKARGGGVAKSLRH
jgi:hypothetical protein